MHGVLNTIDSDWLKLKGFNFEKLLIDNADYALDVAKSEISRLKDMSATDGFVYGFRLCSNIMLDSYRDCFPQLEVNQHIDNLIKRLEELKSD